MGRVSSIIVPSLAWIVHVSHSGCSLMFCFVFFVTLRMTQFVKTKMLLTGVAIKTLLGF